MYTTDEINSMFEEESPKFLQYDKQSGSRFLDKEALLSFIHTIREKDREGIRKWAESTKKDINIKQIGSPDYQMGELNILFDLLSFLDSLQTK